MGTSSMSTDRIARQPAVARRDERVADDRLLVSAVVINRDGTNGRGPDKVQLDPSEEGL
jgi:hypothetical protein